MKKIIFTGLTIVLSIQPISALNPTTDIPHLETTVAGTKSQAEKQAGSTIGIQSMHTGGGVSDSSLGNASGAIIGQSVSTPASEAKRMQGVATTGEIDPNSPAMNANEDKLEEPHVGPPDYAAGKLELGVGGILPSHSTLKPTYKINRLAE